MNRQAASPAWYCDVTTTGASVVLVPNSHLVFNGAVIPLPYSQNILCVRIAPDGTKFCGIGHHDDRAWEWQSFRDNADGVTGAWTPHGLAFGPRSVMYDNDNRLLTISAPGTEAGSQGMRYIADDGRVVYSHETYADPVRGIWEYTERGNATVGQAGDSGYGSDPCIIIVDGVKRMVEEGTCRFINVYRSWDTFSLAYVREDLNAAVRYTFTLDEARTFPVFAPPDPIVIDPPPIEVDPPPVEIDLPPIVITPPVPVTHVLQGRLVR